MANTGPKGIQTLPAAFRQASGTLASDTARIVDNSYQAITRDFLCKKIRVQLQQEDFPAGHSWLLGFCRGDVTIAEISSILSTVLLDPEDFQLWDDFAQANGIFWETLNIISGNLTGSTGVPAGLVNLTLSLGGGKGIPLEAAHGIAMFIFNPSANTIGAANTVTLGTYQLVGVFMEGSN